jgi:hypothetical protein
MAGVNSSGTSINKNAPSPQTGTALAEGDTTLVIQASSWPILPPFRKGEAPTLLDAAEALKVKMFIENFLLNFTGVMRTGSPERNKFEWVFNPWGNNLDLWIQTDLIHDLTPQLGGDLDVNRRDIFSRGAPLYLDARNAEPVFIVGSTGSHGELRFGGSNRNDYVGFKAGSAPTKIVWELPNADGTTGQVLSTDGSKVLSWVTNGGGGGGMTSFDLAGDSGSTQTITNGDTVTLAGGNGLASVAAATDQVTVAIDDSVAQSIVITAGAGTASGDLQVYFDNHTDANRFGLIAGDNVTIAGSDTNGTIMISSDAGGGGGGGTVTSIDTSSGTFVDVTGGPITTGGTITGDLSATGTADSTTFLRGDNTWAVPSGGSGMTSFYVSDSAGTGSFTVTNGNTIIMKSVAVVVDDYALQVQVGTDVGGGEFVNYYLPYTPIGVFYISDGTTNVPQYEGATIHFQSSDASITWLTVTGGMDAIVASGGPSDERLKKGIKPVCGLLEKIEKLQPVEFEWNEKAASTFKKEGHEIGLVAQDVEKVFPELVGSRKDFKTVDYEKLVPMLVDCVKDLSHQVRVLNEKVKDLCPPLG